MQPGGAYYEDGALYGESLDVKKKSKKKPKKKPINIEEDTEMEIEGEMHNGQQSAGSSLQEFVLEFDNVKFVAGKGKHDKVILQKVNGKITSGHVLAIMGPSGAGKSTLISTLTQDAFYGSAFGTVSLNGIPMSDRLFKRYCYVVKQQDTNWPYLTARETLTYAAELYNLGGDSAEVLVQDLIQKTGLLRCSDVKVQHLSGGQQRRLSIAVALLKKPAVLFLDEPTSGLDAASAQHIMREITSVAKEERLIIICTIHQPSTKVYSGFDQLMIMSKGRQAFVGNATAASAYFDSIGYCLPPATNPAEHFLDIVNADFSSSEEVDAILDTWETRNTPDPSLLPQATTADVYNMRDMRHILVRQTKVMFRRHATLIVRDPILYAGRIACFLVVNCVFGIVYISARNYTQDQASNKLWVSVWYIGVPSNMAVVAVYKLNLELKSIFLEQKNGMGHIASYIIAKTILVTPILFLFSLAALGIPGFVLQNFPSSSFGRHILLFTVQIAMWESSAEAFAALFDDAVTGILVHTTWWFLSLLFSGYLVKSDDMFWPLKTFYYATPYNYYIRSAMYMIFTESTWEPCIDPTTTAVCVNSTNGFDVLESMDRVFPIVTTENTYWSDVSFMLVLGVFWKIVAVLAMVGKARRASTIRDEKSWAKSK